MTCVDVIIPVWRPGNERLLNLQKAVEFWKLQKEVTVTLRVIRCDDEPFNKNWLINCGVRQCKNDRFIVADMDAYAKWEGYLAGFLDWVDKHEYEWAFGYNRFIYEGQDGGKPERNDWPEPGIQEGGVVLFAVDLWERMGGGNEFFKLLRGVDNETAMRARYLTGYHAGYPETIYHRWHPHSPYKNGAHVKHNKELLKYTRKNIASTIELLKGLPWGQESGSYAIGKSFYESRK